MPGAEGAVDESLLPISSASVVVSLNELPRVTRKQC